MTTFSDFFHNATPEEKKKLMLEVAEEANEEQRKVSEEPAQMGGMDWGAPPPTAERATTENKYPGFRDPTWQNELDYIYVEGNLQQLRAYVTQLLTAERADWLRSEIEKLEGAKVDENANVWGTDYNTALTSIITRYKEELLELDKTNGL